MNGAEGKYSGPCGIHGGWRRLENVFVGTVCQSWSWCGHVDSSTYMQCVPIWTGYNVTTMNKSVGTMCRQDHVISLPQVG